VTAGDIACDLPTKVAAGPGSGLALSEAIDYHRGMIRWQWCTLDELTGPEAYEVMAARSAVFVVEQNCVYGDLDGLDLQAQHLIAWSGTAVAAYLRVLGPGARFRERSIGRVLTTATFRRTGLGRTLMLRALADLDTRFPGEPIRISAQAHLEPFYGAFGFTRASDNYLEDGIPHLAMLRSAR